MTNREKIIDQPNRSILALKNAKPGASKMQCKMKGNENFSRRTHFQQNSVSTTGNLKRTVFNRLFTSTNQNHD